MHPGCFDKKLCPIEGEVEVRVLDYDFFEMNANCKCTFFELMPPEKQKEPFWGKRNKSKNVENKLSGALGVCILGLLVLVGVWTLFL